MDTEEIQQYHRRVSVLSKKTPGSKEFSIIAIEGRNARRMIQFLEAITSFDQTSESNDEVFEEREIIENPNFQKERGLLKIQVIDNGIGLSEDGISKLFKPFAQADNTTSQYLSLSIV